VAFVWVVVAPRHQKRDTGASNGLSFPKLKVNGVASNARSTNTHGGDIAWAKIDSVKVAIF
jgi:hypothetical protein